jgi:GPH family glycoside/pentoside/hexuronide:cation symporter
MPDLITIGLSLAIAGIGFVGPLVYTNVLFAQVADEDELKSGVRREGVFFGINALITKPAQSFALIIPAALLSLAGFIPRDLTGGVPQPDLQPDAVFLAIRIFIGLIPGICLLLAAAILQLYPLKGEYWEEVQEKVLELNEEKRKKLEEIEREEKK